MNEMIPSSGSRELALRGELLSKHNLTRDEARKLPFYEYIIWWATTFKKGRVLDVTLNKYLITAQSVYDMAPTMVLSDLEQSRQNVQMLLDKYGLTHQHQTVLTFKGKILGILKSAVEDGHIDAISIGHLNVTSAENYWTVKQRIEHRELPKTMTESDYRLFKTRIDIKLADSLAKEPGFTSSHGNFQRNAKNKKISTQTRLMVLSILLHTGCRFSEALGVKAEDFRDHSMKIDKTWEYKAGIKAGFAPTKNESSIREVRVDPTLMDNVKRYDLWKHQYFPKLRDKPLSYEPRTVWYNSTMNNYFRALQREYGVSPIVSVHKIRHTYISYLLNQGISEGTIAKQVGHADTNMIRKVYGHLLEERKAADGMRIESLMR